MLVDLELTTFHQSPLKTPLNPFRLFTRLVTTMSEPAKRLTKKEKKAQAFRSNKSSNSNKKQKSTTATPFTEEEAVPIQEDINQEEVQATVSEDKKETKKRKRDNNNDDQDKVPVEGEGEEEVPKKKKRQRGKKKSQQQVRPGVDEEGKPRLIVFVGTFNHLPLYSRVFLTEGSELRTGNLPYKITSEEIAKHFEPCGKTQNSFPIFALSLERISFLQHFTHTFPFVN